MILILGDGDLSYSVSLLSHYSGSHLTATVFPSYEELLDIYKTSAEDNIVALQNKGVQVMFSVDATNLPETLCYKLYDSVHFNFPHTGGKSNIKENRKLLTGFFMNVLNTLKDGGHILVSLLPGQGGTEADNEKQRHKGNSWQIQEAAASGGFILKCVEKFKPNENYTLSGYRSTARSFFCQIGLRHTFIYQPFLQQSIQEVMNSQSNSNSLLGMYLRENNMNLSDISIQVNCGTGTFDELISLVVVSSSACSENNQDNGSVHPNKRIKKSPLHLDIMEKFGVNKFKDIFYQENITKVMYPPKYSHDVSMWSTSSTPPNIITSVIGVVGLSLHSVSIREVYHCPKTKRYSHNYTVVYSHPYEAMSEAQTKILAHTFVRDKLTEDGFELH